MTLSALNLRFGTQYHSSTACLISILNALETIDIGSCGKVRGLDVLHEPVSVNIRIVYISTAAIDDFSEIMCRYIRRHSDSDTVSAIDQQIRHLCRHDRWLKQGIVKVGHHVHGVLLKVIHHMLTHLRESTLSISHGGR